MKPQIIFVGSFRKAAKDGSVGGQMFACTSLVGSALKEEFDFVLIDTTADSVPPPPIWRRCVKALNRLFLLVHRLFTTDHVECVLIFSSAGFSFFEKGLMVLLSRLWGKKIIFAPRSGLIRDNYEKSSFFKWYIPFIIRRADVVLCQGKSWKEFYQNISGAEDKKFKVVQNWIDVVPYNFVRSYELSTSPLRILYMGWLEPYKGIFDLIEALKILKRQSIQLHIVICGMGSCKEEMLRQIADHDLTSMVEFVGWVRGEDKMKQLKEADVFVLPSHREGMPNALMEAMASGIAVIASRAGAVESLVTNDVNGKLVDIASPEQLAQALYELNNNPEKRIALAQAGKLYIEQNNSLDHAVSAFREIFTPTQVS